MAQSLGRKKAPEIASEELGDTGSFSAHVNIAFLPEMRLLKNHMLVVEKIKFFNFVTQLNYGAPVLQIGR